VFVANTDAILLSCSRIFTRFFNVDRIGVNEWLRVPSVQDVYAIGDCSGFLESTGKEVLPALAQVVSCFLLQYKSVTEHLHVTTAVSLFAWLISRTFSANKQYFSLITNQPTVLSAMAYQPNEQGNSTFSHGHPALVSEALGKTDLERKQM